MNFDSLLNPISEESPCGEDLSFSPEFDAIQAAQREDDSTLDQGVWITPLKTANWDAVQAQCVQLLSHRSKDLRLVVWLAEASAQNFGYEGLLRGLKLCLQMSERYWALIHPLPDTAGDYEERIGCIQWFLQRMVTLSALPPLTQSSQGVYNFRDLTQAKTLAASSKPSSQQEVTLEKFTASFKDTSSAHIHDTLRLLQECLYVLGQWQEFLDAKLGTSRPSFAFAREALESVHHEVQRLAQNMGRLQATPLPKVLPTETPSLPKASSPAVADATPAQGAFSTREQALTQLREIAIFFRKTEPHSPVAYLAEKAAAWGDMPLHEWLRAVVKDNGTLSGLEELLGLQSPAKS